ncbi:MAG: PhnD/SsuA/transferrin family substrate-binding protein [Burkholderiaceae bacterium]|nr:PhnD/SsuA/transferrin family substrate-binding protein [Burkholderiaceae bacterium]
MAATAFGPRTHAAQPLRFGTTPVFLDDQIALLALWQHYLESRLERPVSFVQRGSYREIVDLLFAESIDVAWLCGFPFVLYPQRIGLVAVPTYHGKPLYQSYLIVPASDTATAHVGQLEGRVFAYSDPLSNSGYLVPRAELLRVGRVPERFFRRSFFTFGHRKVVQAVQLGLADAGAVDGYVWDTLARQQPHATHDVRIAWRSPYFGFPPVVARASLSQPEREAMTSALQGMSRSDRGRHLLERLNIDGFARAEPGLFDGIRDLVRIAVRPGA